MVTSPKRYDGTDAQAVPTYLEKSLCKNDKRNALCALLGKEMMMTQQQQQQQQQRLQELPLSTS